MATGEAVLGRAPAAVWEVAMSYLIVLTHCTARASRELLAAPYCHELESKVRVTALLGTSIVIRCYTLFRQQLPCPSVLSEHYDIPYRESVIIESP